jgi:hypothetical protein
MNDEKALKLIIDFTEDMINMQNKISGEDKLPYTRGYIDGMKNAGDFIRGMLEGIKRSKK